ncbi:hypothetical protein [Ruminococcus sp. 5_1_39BFAA]|uniref:hypothetical protein n=1 Tax=Ruminococcus sp. 5_1_39BFAA TaxID=457412 RepID=UPI0035675044
MIKKALYILALSLSPILLYMFPIHASDNADVVSVNILNDIYYGTLESENNGTTIFTANASNDKMLTITGKWSDKLNAFNGDCLISYEDGTVQSVTYKKGIISKQVKTIYPDGTYQTFTCNSGIPCKKILTYSEDDELLDLDWYHQGKSVKELTQSALSSDYRALLSNPYDYVDLPLKVCGTVEAIYEIPTHSYLKIRDTENHLYLFNYPNGAIQPFFSTNIENVSVGDAITIYGFFNALNDYINNPLALYEHTLGYEMDFKDLEDSIRDPDFLASVQAVSQVVDDDLEKKFPVFSAFYWESDKSRIDPVNLTFSYSDICQYPYYYKDEELSLSGKIIYENASTSSSKVSLLIQKADSTEIYGITYKTSDYSSLLGQSVSCSGLGDGNIKIPYYHLETKTMGYALFPNIKASELKILSE